MRNAAGTISFRWFKEVWNEGKKDSIDQLLAENVIANGLGPDGKTVGIEAFKQFYDDFRKQIKNVYVTVNDVIYQDDIECSLCTVTGKDAANDKQIEFSGICMVRLEDGKIAEAWNHYDFLKMYQQMGFRLTQQ